MPATSTCGTHIDSDGSRLQDLRGHAHRLPAPGQEELVGVGVLGDQHVGDQAGEPAQQAPVVVGDGVQGQRHHPHLIASVQQEQVHPYAAGLRHLDDIRAEEGPAGGEPAIGSGWPTCSFLPGSGTSSSWA
ncbi:hypothetical protein ACTMTI_55200 [Nonomuraea sp. H19]|uniref:hypothetical protein n=1 Tax=Nonomuraea sp. H19 TaxID=3452206 RepID=UPI003F8B61BA